MIYLRIFFILLWKNPIDQIITEENFGGVYWSFYLYYDLCICACKCYGTFPVANLSKKGSAVHGCCNLVSCICGQSFCFHGKRSLYCQLSGTLYDSDFGDSITDHGGITDRMDCQMLMAVFAYIYHQSFVVPQSISVEAILDQILTKLTYEEQYALYSKISEIIEERLTGQS